MIQYNARHLRRIWFVLMRSTASDVVKFLLLVAALTWLMYRGTEMMGYHWQWHRVPRYIASFEDGRFTRGPLLDGLLLTPLQALWIGIGLYIVMPRLYRPEVGKMLRPNWVLGTGLVIAFLVFGYFCIVQLPAVFR